MLRFAIITTRGITPNSSGEQEINQFSFSPITTLVCYKSEKKDFDYILLQKKMVRSSLFAAVILILCFSKANGLKCYQCIYLSDENGKPVPGFDDSSCASGNTPTNTHHLDECSGSKSGVAPQLNRTTDTGVVMFNRSIAITADISPKEITIWGCQKVYAYGNINGKKYRMTSRSCVSSYVEFPEGCSKTKLKDWRKKDSQWALLVATEVSVVDNFDSETQVTGCYCTGDKCNSAKAIVVPRSLIFLVGNTLQAYAAVKL